MIRPRDLPDSIVAQLVPVSAFLHSLGHNRPCRMASRHAGLASDSGRRWARSARPGYDPACVKTQAPRPIAQQLNREGRVDESLLRQSAVSRFNISSRSPENRFYTAWTHCRHLSSFVGRDQSPSAIGPPMPRRADAGPACDGRHTNLRDVPSWVRILRIPNHGPASCGSTSRPSPWQRPSRHFGDRICCSCQRIPSPRSPFRER